MRQMRQRGCLAWRSAAASGLIRLAGRLSARTEARTMAVTVAAPAVEAMRGRHSFGDDHLDADREAPDRGPAQNQIAELAVLLSNTRGSMILGGSVLSALTIGIALEAMFSPSVLRPGLAGAVTVSLLGCVILCWLRAAALLLLAGRPLL